MVLQVTSERCLKSLSILGRFFCFMTVKNAKICTKINIFLLSVEKMKFKQLEAIFLILLSIQSLYECPFIIQFNAVS